MAIILNDPARQVSTSDPGTRLLAQLAQQAQRPQQQLLALQQAHQQTHLIYPTAVPPLPALLSLPKEQVWFYNIPSTLIFLIYKILVHIETLSIIIINDTIPLRIWCQTIIM
jgi:hypothetical protein